MSERVQIEVGGTYRVCLNCSHREANRVAGSDGRGGDAMSPTDAQVQTATCWLLEQGYVEHDGAGGYDVTADGQQFMLWALWIAFGCPGMADDVYKVVVR